MKPVEKTNSTIIFVKKSVVIVVKFCTVAVTGNPRQFITTLKSLICIEKYRQHITYDYFVCQVLFVSSKRRKCNYLHQSKEIQQSIPGNESVKMALERQNLKSLIPLLRKNINQNFFKPMSIISCYCKRGRMQMMNFVHFLIKKNICMTQPVGVKEQNFVN